MFLIAVFLFTGALPAAGGTADAAEITDMAGDANGLNGQGRTAVDGRDTKPASVDSADLRAVWFETTYATVQTVDSTGKVTEVRHVANGLRVHIRTEAPVHPSSTPQMRPLFFDVAATVGSCDVVFQLGATASAATDSVNLGQLSAGCPDGVSPTGEVTRPTYEDAVATLDFPFGIGRFGAVLKPQSTIAIHNARSARPLPFAGNLILDEALATSTFVIGQDVPADVDCATDPTHADCQS